MVLAQLVRSSLEGQDKNDNHCASQAHGFQGLNLGYRESGDNVSTSPGMVLKTIN